MREYFQPSKGGSRAAHAHVFDSVAEMVERCEQPASPAQAPSLVQRIAHRSGGDEWAYGTLKDAATYNRTMREGWRDALPRIEALAAKVSPKVAAPLDVRRKIRKGPDGDELDIHQVYGGNLGKAWTARKRTVARAPAPIRLICNVVYNSGADSTAFFWRGACALAMVRALRKKGYRTAISGLGLLVSPYANSPRNGLDYVARFDALSYGQAIDTARLAAVLCTSAMLRHVIFHTILTTPPQVNGGFGYAPSDAQSTRCIVECGAFPNASEERLVIPDISNEHSAGEWLAKVSAQFA